MTSIIVVLPKLIDAKNMKNLLVRNGYQVATICTSGAQALAQLDNYFDGIVISAYRLPDMLYSELHSNLPPGFEMILMASQRYLMECSNRDIVCLPMPFTMNDMVSTVEMLSNTISYKKRKRRAKPKERNEDEIAIIKEAKLLLMKRNSMNEEEAHRYIQKHSMNNSTSMVETAQMVLTMMHI